MVKLKHDIHHMQYCLAKGAVLHPLTYNEFLNSLHKLDRTDKLSLLPIAIFQHFHLKLKKTA